MSEISAMRIEGFSDCSGMIMRRTNVYGHVPNIPYFKSENA